jgi:hypothetical protein
MGHKRRRPKADEVDPPSDCGRNRERTKGNSDYVPGGATALALHREYTNNPEEEQRRIVAAEERPHASKFTKLSQVTVKDQTIGYNPTSGVRRVQASYYPQSTQPISADTLQMQYLENLELLPDDSNLIPRTLQYLDVVIRLPNKMVRGKSNPLLYPGITLSSWLDIRRAVNTRPDLRTDSQLAACRFYLQCRRQVDGNLMPCCMTEALFDTFTEWENDPGCVPASIREDSSKVLLSQDVWVHWIIGYIIRGKNSGRGNARAKHLRLYLLAFFKDGAHLWFQIPCSGITPDKNKLPRNLVERVQTVPEFVGPHKGEEGVLRFGQHLRRHIYIDSTEVPLFSSWSARVMSGKSFNSDANVRPPTNPPRVPSITFSEGKLSVF